MHLNTPLTVAGRATVSVHKGAILAHPFPLTIAICGFSITSDTDKYCEVYASNTNNVMDSTENNYNMDNSVFSVLPILYLAKNTNMEKNWWIVQ